MKKQISTMLALVAVAGATCFYAPTASANYISNLNDSTVVVRQPGQSMLLSMREAAGVFVGRYVKAAVHSISLHPAKGNFQYVVTGYTPKQKITIHVDVITGKVRSEVRSSKVQDVPSKIFNPLEVISTKDAEAIAVAAVGGEGMSRGWTLSANNNVVSYEVDVHTMESKVTVTIDAKTGDVLSKTEPVKLELVKEEQDPDAPKPFSHFPVSAHN